MFDTFANDEQFALEGILVGHAGAAANEHLAHDRFDGARGIGDIGVVTRHVAPAQQGLCFFMDDTGDDRFAGDAAILGLRQKDDAAGIVTGSRQLDVESCGFLAQEGIRHLQQDASTVAQLGVITGGAAVCQVGKNLQTLADNLVTLLAFDVCDKADATGIMFVAWAVQALLLRIL